MANDRFRKAAFEMIDTVLDAKLKPTDVVQLAQVYATLHLAEVQAEQNVLLLELLKQWRKV